jgi:hypothetical protein
LYLGRVCQEVLSRKIIHHQRDMAVHSALALCEQFTVHGYVLEKTKAYRYLGRLLLQDDNDIQAMQSQLCNVRGTWARVYQMFHRENAPPRTRVKFYKAIVQSVLLYRSKTWVLSKAVMARLEGFHIRVVYWMAIEHVPCRGHTTSGCTHHLTRCSRSVGCTPSRITSMYSGRQLQGT